FPYTTLFRSIEIIQSRLFLSRVLDSAKLDISYYSLGRVLNDELYQSRPFTVTYKTPSRHLFNIPVYFEKESNNNYTLTIGEKGRQLKGTFGTPLDVDGGNSLTIHDNPAFQ